MKPPATAIEALLDGTHADPFSLLGVHEGPGGCFARTILPGAAQAEAFSLSGKALGMLTRIDPRGLFEGPLTGPRQPVRYRCRAQLQDEGHGHRDEQGAHADGGEGEAEELDEGRAKEELPAEDGRRPAVVDEVAGGGERAGHHDVGAVVADAHLGIGTAYELADEHGERAEESRNTEPAHTLNEALRQNGWLANFSG